MNTPVFIMYETKSREFDGRLLLLSWLTEIGYKNFYFGSRSSVKSLALTRTNGIVIIKSLAKEDEMFYEKCKILGHDLVLMHVEGGIHYKDNLSSIKNLYSFELLNYCSYNLVFGKAIKKTIDSLYGSKDLKCRTLVTGDPRFDMLKPKFRYYFAEKIANLKELYGDFILVNTSFGLRNNFTNLENLKVIWKNQGYTDEAVKLLELKYDTLELVLAEYIQMIKSLSCRYPSVRIVVRPHPSESLEYYTHELRMCSNVFVTREGNVVPWIHACSSVIHYDCTTGIESVIAQKLTISYCPIRDERINAWLPISVSVVAEQLANLFSVLDKKFPVMNELDYSQNIQMASDYVHNMKHSSSRSIKGVFREILLTKNESKFLVMKYLFVKFVSLLGRLITLFNVKNHVNNSESKFGQFSLIEIVRNIRVLTLHENGKYFIKIKSPIKNVAHIKIYK